MLTPAWNLWANVRNLLTFREDREITTRDEHGRFPPTASPRSAIDPLDVPVANDTNALLLDALVALAAGEEPRFCLDADLVPPPGLVLSHDLDQLRGND